MENLYSIKSKWNRMKKYLKHDEWCLRKQVKTKTEYLGNAYGGWRVAFEYIPPESVVYSFGVGEDISFDTDLIRRHDARIYAFDPTPKSIEWIKEQNLSNNFHFYKYGLSDKDGIEKFYLPKNENFVSGSIIESDRLKSNPIDVQMRRLSTIMKEFRHDKIDLLKMDIEGSEFKVIPDILKENISIRQICIELHGRFFPNGAEMHTKLIEMLNERGYYMVYVSDSFMECTFLKMK